MASTPDRDVYTISRLNQEARELLESGLARVWIEGELSNVARPASGHLYFTLKDSRAQVRAAMFRSRNQLLRFRPAEGMQVLVRAKVSLYEPRGDYQLIVEQMQEAGDGVLQQAYDALKLKLEKEGLFDPGRKQPLPAMPERLGVITSPSGAAIRDVMSVLARRFPALPVVIYPVPVQGKTAGQVITDMLQTVAQRNECDVLILTRGGGSLEDLWAFNEEPVARAIADCPIPLVSAIGHEVDFTIADFVADMRAPTPSAAAELVSPDQAEWLEQLRAIDVRLARRMQHCTDSLRQRLQWLGHRLNLRHPGQQLRQQAQRQDELEARMRLAIRTHFSRLQTRLQAGHARLQQATPAHRIGRLRVECDALGHRLTTAMHALLANRQQRLAIAGRSLDTVSPLATLERGYSIVTRVKDNTIVRKGTSVKVGDQIKTRLSKGRLVSTVEKITQ